MEDTQVLVVDDDPETVQLIKIIFEREGAAVATAKGGREGLRKFYRVRPDLVILDLMMDDMDGWEVCRRIRDLTDVPVLILSHQDAEDDVVRGLSLGADDFVGKPVSRDVLLARARALLRRAPPAASNAQAAFDDGHLRVDVRGKRVEVDGELAKLTRTEYRLLELLVRNRGRICTMDHIQDHVWGGEKMVTPETVHVFVSQLRKKIEPARNDHRYIQTEYGIGYRFEGG